MTTAVMMTLDGVMEIVDCIRISLFLNEERNILHKWNILHLQKKW